MNTYIASLLKRKVIAVKLELLLDFSDCIKIINRKEFFPNTILNS